MVTAISFDNMQRYFVSLINNSIQFSNEDVHHILKVMRGKIGDRIELVFDHCLYLGEIIKLNPFEIKLVEKLSQDVELKNEITLFFALAKGDKNEFVIQKATELGVKKIVFLNSTRSVVKLKQEDFDKKINRYQKIAKEASEQSHRLLIPEIIGVYDIKKIPSSLLAERNFLAFEVDAGMTTNTFKDLKENSYSVLIGAEGGLTEQEVEILSGQGFERISLGKRILRCETAAVYALSVLSFLLEK